MADLAGRKNRKRTIENAKRRSAQDKKRREYDTPIERQIVRLGTVPSHSEIATSLRQNGPGSRYPIFEEKLENCGINERTLEMSILIDYHVIIVHLQINGNAGSARSLCWYF